jgi:hypothetical protein
MINRVHCHACEQEVDRPGQWCHLYDGYRGNDCVFVPDLPPPGQCDGYNHPRQFIRKSRDGEWGCIGCGVTLV